MSTKKIRTATAMALALGIWPAAAAARTCPAPRFTLQLLSETELDRGWIGGVSLVDVDGDGDLDLYAAHGYDTSPNTSGRAPAPDQSVLYLNDGRGGLQAAPDNDLSNTRHYASGAAFADMDADGDMDVFIGTQIGQRDAFYRNLGQGRFERQDLGEATSTPGSSFSSTWADIDADGDLDIHAGGPALEMPEASLIYRNDAGVFTRMADAPVLMPRSNGATTLWADLDNDGDADMVMAGSDIARRSNIPAAATEFPVVFRNDGGGAHNRLYGQPFDAAHPSISAALGDIDADGDLDLFLGAYVFGPPESIADTLYRNDGKGLFSAVDGFAPAPHSEFATGGAFADFDGDGDLDLIWTAFNSSIEVMLNDGSGAFTRLEDPALAARKTSHSSIAVGDLDGDGDMDAVIGNWGDAPGGDAVTVVRNESAPCRDWTDLVLFDRAGAPNPVGARVTLIEGGRRHRREAMATTGFRSQSGSPFLFSLPASGATAEIRWPDGAVQRVDALVRNGRTVVRRAP